jgi:hypothetical protein
MVLSTEQIKQVAKGQRQMLRHPRTSTKPPWKPNHAYRLRAKDGPTYVVTCTSIEPATFDDEPVWLLRFVRGDHTDRDRVPAARCGGPGGDYVDNASRALAGTGAEVEPRLQAKFGTEAREREIRTRSEAHEGAIQAIGAFGSYLPTGKAQKRLKSALWQLERIDEEVA